MILKSRRTILQCLVFLLLFMQNLTAQNPDFGDRQDRGEIQNNDIDEASGLAASRKNPGVLWTHNDSGDNARLFAMDLQGRHLGEYTLVGINNRDWEDIAIGPGPVEGEQYLYIGDIGDNDYEYNDKFIYRIPEPVVNPAAEAENTSLSGVETITFQYPDFRYNAEALMIDPVSGDLYVVTKAGGIANIFKLPYPQSFDNVSSAEFVTSLELLPGNFSKVTGAEISPDGSEMLIKTYLEILYWQRSDDQNWFDVLQQEPVNVPYMSEPQGEAVCWAADGSGYYTLSEETLNLDVHLYFYPRLDPTTVRQSEKKPGDIVLKQNFPNPFNPTTDIPFQVKENSNITLKIYSTTGQLVRRLFNSNVLPGEYRLCWDGRDDRGNSVASGIYLYQLEDGTCCETRRMLLFK